VVNITLRPFYPNNETWYPLNNRLSGAHSRSARFRKDKIFFHLPEFESRTVWPRSQFAIPITLPGPPLVIVEDFMVHRYTKSLRISVGTPRAEESYRSYPFQIQPPLICLCPYGTSLNRRTPNIHYHILIYFILRNLIRYIKCINNQTMHYNFMMTHFYLYLHQHVASSAPHRQHIIQYNGLKLAI